MAESLLAEARKYEVELIQTYRTLHHHAEIGFELTKTKAYVEKCLSEMGYETVSCGKCGLVATAGKQTGGKGFLLRADMDALPIWEETGLTFAATDGQMHACGHDMHTTMLLGAARLLKEHENELKGCVKLMFQPAEEILEGAKDMVEAGVLEQPKVDAAMMIHVMTGVSMKTGTVVVAPAGVSAPAADFFRIKVQGKGCHGSTPHQGIDSLTAAAHILIALQELQAREMAIADEAVLTIGRMDGGSAANVIADTTVMEGTIRSYDEELRNNLKNRMCEIAEGIAGAFRANAEVTFTSGCPTLINDERLVKSVTEYTRSLLGGEWVYSSDAGGITGKSKMSGSEDFAYVSQRVPSVMLALAAGEEDNPYPLHHPKVRFDEQVLAVGSAVYAHNAMEWLKEHGEGDVYEKEVAANAK